MPWEHRPLHAEQLLDVFHTGFFAALRNSIDIALTTTLLALLFASSAAPRITRLGFPGTTLILAGALVVTMFPVISIVGGLSWRVVGLLDTWPGLSIPYLSLSLPLCIYILSAFFREIAWYVERLPVGQRAEDGVTLPPLTRRAAHPVQSALAVAEMRALLRSRDCVDHPARGCWTVRRG